MKQSKLITLLGWLFIVLGIVLRFDQYGLNRSLWLDEAFIATNFIDKTFLELLQPPLDYSDSIVVPPGFLVITKLLTLLLGYADWVLRLFPLFSGILALFLFYLLAKQFISSQAVPLALFLFAISGNLIYYSSEFKQYSSDVLIAIILLLLANYLHKTTITHQKLLFSALVGALVVWFSHPAAFILATIGIYLLIDYSVKRQWVMVIQLTLVSLFWLSSFLLMYTFIAGEGIESSKIGQYLVHLWTTWQAFMPFPFSREALTWIHDHYFKLFSHPGNLNETVLASILFIIGCFSLFARRKTQLFLLVFPIIVVMLVSHFQRYPFLERMLLFLLPTIYLIVAEGVLQIQIQASHYFKFPVPTLIIQLILIFHLVQFPIYHRQYVQEIKPVLQYVQQHSKKSDIIYVYHWAEPAFRYYARDYGFDYHNCHIITPIPQNEYVKEIDYFRFKQNIQPIALDKTACVLGISEWHEQAHVDIEQLYHQGGRVWFIFSHAQQPQETLFLKQLDRLGTKNDEFQQPGASTYLYTFARINVGRQSVADRHGGKGFLPYEMALL